METKNTSLSYKINWFVNIIKHGLLIQGIRNRLAKIGIDIMPYYWTEEDVLPLPPPKIKGDEQEFKLDFLTENDIKKIEESIVGIRDRKLLENFKKGQKCIGLFHNNEIAAYMFIENNNFTFRAKRFFLDKNQAYLLSMYTFEKYRGKNLAPYLRYKSYQLLNNSGIDQKFSVTEYFNKSSKRFKDKLHAKHKKLYVDINLFNAFKRCYLLKTYS